VKETSWKKTEMMLVVMTDACDVLGKLNTKHVFPLTFFFLHNLLMTVSRGYMKAKYHVRVIRQLGKNCIQTARDKSDVLRQIIKNVSKRLVRFIWSAGLCPLEDFIFLPSFFSQKKCFQIEYGRE
jgi:hypothetical protein